MNFKNISLKLFALILFLGSIDLYAQDKKTSSSYKLSDIATIQKRKDAETLERVLTLAKQKKWSLTIKGKEGNIAHLVGVDEKGYPLYAETSLTTNAAATIGTSKLWEGGSTGLNVSGSNPYLKDKVAVWDGGGVNNLHQELTGRIVAKDAQSGADGHATHVTGIMMSKGVVSYAKGMAYNLPNILSYTFNGHLSEMAEQAPNLLVSNHSYGTISGWRYNDAQTRWEWYGQFNQTEDYKFGFYNSEAQFWDSLTYMSSNYTIVKAAGNNRNEKGPADGTNFWRFNAQGILADAGPRTAAISSQEGYDNLPTYATAKNILTVGNIQAMPYGFTKPSDVVLNSNSSVGPTDDGRIKPDIVANGTSITSTYSGNNQSYATLTGTSMASPTVAGSAVLLHELYYTKNESAAWSSTIRGVIIHSASSASGYPGPDYMHGWGVPDFGLAGQIISNSSENLVQQKTLANGTKYSVDVVASGKTPLKVSICWIDPPGSVNPDNPVNDRSKKLVHDLDVRVIRGNRTYYPWKLQPTNPSMQAIKDDNDLDNVEVIELDSTIAGEKYTIEVTHKGTLTRTGSQIFSLIASGVGGKTYNSSAPTSSAGSKIDSVSVGLLKNANTTGCKTYSDFRNQKIVVEPGQSLPFYIKATSCDATNATKFAKIFIDFNNDGDFEDANETVATSSSLTNNSTFSGNISLPVTITKGSILATRIVLSETTSAANISSTGTYPNGETQDYQLTVITPSNDMAGGKVVYPQIGECGTDKKYATVKLRNLGTVEQNKTPVEVQISKGSTLVATLRDTCRLNIPQLSDIEFTLQAPFTLDPGTTYSFKTIVNLTGDQIPGNNAETTQITTSAADASPTNLIAQICNGKEVRLKANNTGGAITWFTSPTAKSPFATSINGTLISNGTITADKKYYAASNDIRGTVGPVNKMVYPDGGYNNFAGNFVRFNNQVPMLIESVRMYTANPGKITIILADIASENGTGGYSYYNRGQRVFNVTNSRPDPVPGAVTENNAKDTGFIYNLNFQVLDTGKHILIMQCSEGASVFRNNNIAAPGPYPARLNEASSLFSITGNGVTAPNDPNQFYYFFYDMKVSTLLGCPSARTAVTAANNTVPVITQNGVTLTSSIEKGNQWILNGTDIAGANLQQYTAATSGLYKVSVMDSLGCVGVSNEINVVVTAVNNVDPSKIGMLIAPNPNRGQFRIQFNVKNRETLDISVLNITGQQVYRKSYDKFSGEFNETINLQNVSPGIYMLKVTHGDNHYLKRMVID